MARKFVTIAVGLAVTATSGAAVTALYAHWRAATEIERLVATTNGLSVGTVDVDTFGGRVILGDVVLTTGAVRIKARTLSLPSRYPSFGWVGSAAAASGDGNGLLQLAQWPGTRAQDKAPDAPASHGIELKIPGQSAAPAPPPPPTVVSAPQNGSASASDVTIVYGATTYKIKKIDLAGTSLTNADLAAMLDPKSPATIADRLKSLNAASIVMPSLSRDDKSPDAEFHADLTQVLLANVSNGRIGAASAAGITATAKDAKGAGSTAKTGAIQAAGLDLALATHLLDGVRKDESEPLKTLSESLTINDIAVTGNDGTAITIASIAQKDLKARPLKYDIKTLGNATDAPGDETAKTTREKAIFDDVASSFEVGSYAVGKLNVAGKDKDGAFNLAIASIGLQDFRARKLATFAIRDLAIAGTEVKASFETFDLANIVIPTVSTPAEGPAAGALATDTVPAAGKADIGHIAVDTSTKNDDGSTTKVKFTVAHVGLSSDQMPGHVPTQGSLALDNLVFDIPDVDSPGARELLAMGYKKADMSLAVSTTYDQAAETLAIQKFLVNGVDMGSVNVAVDFANVNKGIMSANQSLAKASALAILLKRVDIKLLNNGLFEKALNWKAKQDGKPVAALRDDGIDFFKVQLPASFGDDPAITRVGAAIAKFIANPRTLHISAASKDGLGVSDMALVGAPDELLKRLDIAAEANQ